MRHFQFSDEWFMAASTGQTKILLDQVSRGSDINAKDAHGMTALMHAVEGGSIESVETLIALGADINMNDMRSWTAMTRAVIQSKGWVVLQARCWPGRCPDPRSLNLLIAAGGQCGLREAVLLGDLESAERAVHHVGILGINGSAQFCFDETYLMIAASLGHVHIAELLIEHGADVNAIDDVGHTALMRASESGALEIIELLIYKGAQINWGWPCDTALSEAQAHGQQAAVHLLLSHGAKRRLMDAVDSDDIELARELLLHGADPGLEHVWLSDNSGESAESMICVNALEYAYIKKKNYFVRLFQGGHGGSGGHWAGSP